MNVKISKTEWTLALKINNGLSIDEIANYIERVAWSLYCEGYADEHGTITLWKERTFSDFTIDYTGFFFEDILIELVSKKGLNIVRNLEEPSMTTINLYMNYNGFSTYTELPNFTWED